MSPSASAAGGGRSGGPPSSAAPTTGNYLYGYAEVELRGNDVAGITLPFQDGGVITGRVVLTGAAAGVRPADLTKTRIALSSEGGSWNVSSNGMAMGPSLASQAISTVQPDGTFADEPESRELSG